MKNYKRSGSPESFLLATLMHSTKNLSLQEKYLKRLNIQRINSAQKCKSSRKTGGLPLLTYIGNLKVFSELKKITFRICLIKSL